MDTTIAADRALDCLILFHRGFCKEQAELEYLQHFSIDLWQETLDCLFVQGPYFDPALSQPALHLWERIGVL